VKYVSDRVAVIYVGRIVSSRRQRAIHPSPALLSAVPTPAPRLRAQRVVLDGKVADATHPAAGCAFRPRCRVAVECCRVETPALPPAPKYWYHVTTFMVR
jgi:oligopeptide/dipeptide ABC transporter ATP-binding protein